MLITGAAGGIGSILSDNLFAQGHSLVLVDNLTSGSRLNFAVSQNSDSLICCSTSEALSKKELLGDIDIIINLAAISSLVQCELDSTLALKTNTLDLIPLIRFATQRNIPIIQASTSAVYENVSDTPFQESMQVEPTLVYSMSKRMAENLLIGAGELRGLKFQILRIFNVFGPRQDMRRKSPPFVNYLIRETALGRVPSVYAPLNQARDYICVDDVVALITRFIEEPVLFEKNRILNVCRGEAISVSDILHSIEIGLGKKIQFTQGKSEELWEDALIQLEKYGPVNRERVKRETLRSSIGDTNLMRNEISWSPSHNVLDCIRQNSKQIYSTAQLLVN